MDVGSCRYKLGVSNIKGEDGGLPLSMRHLSMSCMPWKGEEWDETQRHSRTQLTRPLDCLIYTPEALSHTSCSERDPERGRETLHLFPLATPHSDCKRLTRTFRGHRSAKNMFHSVLTWSGAEVHTACAEVPAGAAAGGGAARFADAADEKGEGEQARVSRVQGRFERCRGGESHLAARSTYRGRGCRREGVRVILRGCPRASLGKQAEGRAEPGSAAAGEQEESMMGAV